MKETLHIKVFGSSQANKPLLERMIPIDESLSIDYTSLFRSFRFLFGKNCLIQVEYY